MVRVAADGVLGLLRLDFFPRRGSPSCRSGFTQLCFFTEPGNAESWRLDALDRNRARNRALAKFPGNVFNLVAPPTRPGLRGRIRLRLRRRALIYPTALRALHLLPILKEFPHEKKNRRRELENEHDPGRSHGVRFDVSA